MKARVDELDPEEIERVLAQLGRTVEDLREAIALRSDQLTAEEYAKAIAPSPKKLRRAVRRAP